MTGLMPLHGIAWRNWKEGCCASAGGAGIGMGAAAGCRWTHTGVRLMAACVWETCLMAVCPLHLETCLHVATDVRYL